MFEDPYSRHGDWTRPLTKLEIYEERRARRRRILIAVVLSLGVAGVCLLIGAYS